MIISAIRAWQIDLPLREGRYSWADGKFVEVFDSTLVQVETDAGIVGFGECCPLGPVYLPSYAAGVRCGIGELAPHLLGADPINLGAINRIMDSALKGHPYVKSPLDIACWDILGKVAGKPVAVLLGGFAQSSVPLYRAISQESAESMANRVQQYREEGYRKFQLKVGGDPATDIKRIHTARKVLPVGDTLVADANTGWTRHEAAQVVAATRELDIFVEQPCPTFEECLSIRRRTSQPFVLDEIIDTTSNLVRGLSEDAMDAINLKISRVGGITRARLMRDLCVEAGIPMIVEDSWGGDVTTAAIAHLAISTPEEFCFAATDFNSYGTVSIAANAPVKENGRLAASDRPGLGVDPDLDLLGKPCLEFRV